MQWCRCSQSSLSVVDSLCEAVQHQHGSDGRAGQVGRARGETHITCLGNLVQGRTKKEGGAECLESCVLAVSAHPTLLPLSYAHTHRHTLPSPLPSSLPVCLRCWCGEQQDTLGWAAWRHREGQGAQVRHFLFFLSSVPQLFVTLHKWGCCREALSFEWLVLWIASVPLKTACSVCWEWTLSEWWSLHFSHWVSLWVV